MSDVHEVLRRAAEGHEVTFTAEDVRQRVRHRSQRRRVGALVVAAAAAVGFGTWGLTADQGGGTDVEVADEPGAEIIRGGLVGRWTPTAYSAVVVVLPGGFLEFDDDGGLVGSDGCNHFGATWEVVESRLVVGAIESTTQDCPESNETGLLDILARDPSIGVFDGLDGSLQLSAGDDFAAFIRAEATPGPSEDRGTAATSTTTSNETTTTISTDGAELPQMWVGHDRDQQLVAVNTETGEKQVLAQFDDADDFGNPDQEPVAGGSFLGAITLSPDGQTVYWEQCCEPAPGVIFRAPVGGGTPEQVTFGAYPALSPDGRTLAVVELQWLSLVDLATGNVRRIIATGEAPVALANPAWSPDGTSLAFERYDTDTTVGRLMEIVVDATSLEAARELVGPAGGLTPMLPSYDRRGRLHLIRQRGGTGGVGAPAEAVVIDPDSKEVVSQRQIAAVLDQEHDPSGTYLLRTYLDLTVEYRDGDGVPVTLGEGYLAAAW